MGVTREDGGKQGNAQLAGNVPFAAQAASLPVAWQVRLPWESVEPISLAFEKTLIERALGTERSQHLGCQPETDQPGGSSNHRNDASAKTVLTGGRPVRNGVPRHREGSFEPLRIAKHEPRFSGFDDKTYLALGILPDGTRDILIAVTDGLKGWAEVRVREREAICTTRVICTTKAICTTSVPRRRRPNWTPSSGAVEAGAAQPV